VFLDTDERRRMAQNPHEYLIEQLQFTGDESVGSSSNKIKLNFNHPCKELIWVVQPDANVDYCASLDCNSVLYKTLGAQPFNYTDAVDALPNAIHAFAGPESIGDNAGDFITASGLFHDAGAADAAAGGDYWSTNMALSGSNLYNSAGGQYGFGDVGGDVGGWCNLFGFRRGSFVLSETALTMHCWGENPVVTAKLQLNGLRPIFGT